MGNNRAWPAAQTAALEQLWSEGMSSAAISREMPKYGPPRSKSAVVGMANRLQLDARLSPIKLTAGGKVEEAPAFNREREPQPEPVDFKPSKTLRQAGAATVALARERTAQATAATPPEAAPDQDQDEVLEHVWPAAQISARGRTCCWPIGEPGTPNFRFCGAVELIPGRPYCLDHCNMAYAPMVRRREKAIESSEGFGCLPDDLPDPSDRSGISADRPSKQRLAAARRAGKHPA